MGRERRTLRIIGARTEQLALRYLLARGLVLLSRNFGFRGGEIDLVMLDDDCVAFVEVRYRSSSAFVAPHLTVDRHKQRRVITSYSIHYTKLYDASRMKRFTIRSSSE